LRLEGKLVTARREIAACHRTFLITFSSIDGFGPVVLWRLRDGPWLSPGGMGSRPAAAIPARRRELAGFVRLGSPWLMVVGPRS
jgi:hypothetical protein